MQNFEHIYNENYSRIYSLTVKMLKQNDEAKDITQDTFIALYNNLKIGTEIKYPKSWLYRVALNKCFDNIKKSKRLTITDLSDNIAQEEKSIENNTSYIYDALNKLDEKNRLLVILYSEGLSYKELSELTEIKYTSIGKTLARAIDKLKKELKTNRDEMF